MAERSEEYGEPHQQEVARRRVGVAALAVVCCGAVLVVVGLGDSMGSARGEVGRSSLEQLLQGPRSARGVLGDRLAARLGTAPREEELLEGSSKKNAFSQLQQAMDGAAKATVAQPKCQTPEVPSRASLPAFFPARDLQHPAGPSARERFPLPPCKAVADAPPRGTVRCEAEGHPNQDGCAARADQP